jgi:DNA-binding Xre family transcriptional regulator
MVQWSLYKLLGRYQAATGQPMSLNQLANDSGITRSVIMTIANGQSKRVDLKTLNRLLDYFADKVEPVSVADLLEYIPGEPQP